MATATITGRSYMPDKVTARKGTWTARPEPDGITSPGTAVVGDDFLGGFRVARDDGAGATMTLETGWYSFWFDADDGRDIGPLKVQITGNTTWGAIIATPAGGFSPARDATVAAPGYAGARSRPFDPASRIYASAAARAAVRRALGHAMGTARGSLVDILSPGDSATAGTFATSIGRDDYASILREQLRAAGYPVTGGYVFAANGGPAAQQDTRWAFTGTWNRSDTTAFYAYCNSTTNTATYTSTDVGTVLECVVFATGTISYKVDGGATETITQTGTSATKITKTGLSLGTHSITVTANGQTYVVAARVRTATGLSISNPAIFGSHTADWLPTAKSTAGSGGSDISWLNPHKLALTTLGQNPRLVIVQLGGNDAIHTGYTLAGMKANLQSIVQAWQSLTPAPAPVVLQRVYPELTTVGRGQVTSTKPPGTTWEQFISATYDVSDARDTALIDNTSLLGDPNTLKAAGLMHTDDLHLTTPGQAAVARGDVASLALI